MASSARRSSGGEDAEATENYSQVIGFLLLAFGFVSGVLGEFIPGSGWIVSYGNSVPVVFLLFFASLGIRTRRRGREVIARPAAPWVRSLVYMSAIWPLIPVFVSIPTFSSPNFDPAFFAAAIYMPLFLVVCFVILTFSSNVFLGSGSRPRLPTSRTRIVAYVLLLILYVEVDVFIFRFFGVLAWVGAGSLFFVILLLIFFNRHPREERGPLDEFLP
jgi:hypothetical protein